MATIHNSDLTNELKDGAKLQQIRDVIPTQLAEKVVPVMEVNPKLLRRINVCKNATANNATSATIYTTPTDKDFFITCVILSVSKDVTSTSLASAVAGTLFTGETISFAGITTETLKSEAHQEVISYPIPIQLKRGTTITVTNTTNVANILTRGLIFGYTVDNPNA